METNKIYKKLKEAIRPLVRKQIDETYITILPIGAKSLNEGFQLNGFSVSKTNSLSTPKTYYFSSDSELSESETIDIEEFSDKGGIITFSTEVNAVKSSENQLVNWVKNKVDTVKNNINLNKKINKVLNKHDDVYGVSIGNFIKGRYKANDGTLYDEKSLSIEIIGITDTVLNRVAKDLANEFKQESVLVKNYETNKIYLVKK